MQPPHQMKKNLKRQKFDKYCHFHRDRKHITEEYIDIRNEIEKIIHQGYLAEFIDMSWEDHKGEKSPTNKDMREHQDHASCSEGKKTSKATTCLLPA